MSINEPENENDNDSQPDAFEQRLRNFLPAKPRPLAIPVRRAPWGAIAVAAILLLVIALSIVVKRSRTAAGTTIAQRTNTDTVVPRPLVAPPVTLGTLNAALRASDQDLNQTLDSASSRLLSQSHRGTALFELAKE